MSPVRTAVIGVGHQGRRHAQKFAALDRSRLLAVVDSDTDRCRSVAEEMGVEAVRDFRELIGQVDAVAVATPTPSHFEIVGAMLDSGIHVLVEKPVTSTADEARALVELSEASGLVLQVGHLERFNPAVAALTPHVRDPQFIESNRIAPYKPRSLEVSVVLDLMIHDIDLIHSLVRSPMAQTEAIGRSIFTDTVDIANARIRFENGCVANVTSSRISLKTERMLRVFQENAYASADLYRKTLALYRRSGEGPLEGPEDITIDTLECEGDDPMMDQSKAFLESVAGGPPPLVSGRIALEALQTAAVISEMVDAR